MGVPRHASQSKTILVVEDDAALGLLLEHALEPLGHTIRLVRAADEALAIQAHEHVDILITDVGLGRMSGIALAAAAREIDRRIRLIFISGHDCNFLETKGMSLADASFLEKPFTVEALVEAVERELQAPLHVGAGLNGQ